MKEWDCADKEMDEAGEGRRFEGGGRSWGRWKRAEHGTWELGGRTCFCYIRTPSNRTNFVLCCLGRDYDKNWKPRLRVSFSLSLLSKQDLSKLTQKR